MKLLFIFLFIFLSPLFSYSGNLGNDLPNLELLFHFDEGKGTTAYDTSPNKSSATLEGAGNVWESAGGTSSGYRMNFDGVTGKLAISSGIAFGASGLNSPTYTFCARVKLETFDVSHKILFLQFDDTAGLRRYFTLFNDGATQLRQVVHASEPSACTGAVEYRSVNNVISLNTITDVCFTFDGNRVRAYGREPFSQTENRREWTVVISAAQTGYCNTNNGQAFLGWYISSNMLWDGWMDECAFFSVALSTAQIKSQWGDRLSSKRGFSQ